MPTLNALALSSAIAVLRAERRAGDAGAAHRLGARQDRPVELRLALADQRQEQLRQRREIGLAERADARVRADARRRSAWRDRLGELRREAGGAARDAGEPHEQRGAHLLGVEEIADADRARHHGAALELRDVVAARARVSTAAPSPVLSP